MSTPTPQEREARIAELRARRFARLRWLALRAVLLAGALVLLGGVAIYWLVTTEKSLALTIASPAVLESLKYMLA